MCRQAKFFHVHTGRTKTNKKKESLQQLILCPLMLKLKKAESISEKSIHKRISNCPVVFFVHGADQSPRMEEGAGAVRKQSPVSQLLTAKTNEQVPLFPSNSHPGPLESHRKAPKNPQWKVLCSDSI